jgi:hypothetical protein
VTKDSQHQGMSELLAQQRAGPILTPSEAARHRRSAQREPVPDSVETPAEMGPATGEQPAEVTEATAPEAEGQARTRIKGTLVAAACAVAVAVICWRVAGRRRQAQR